MSATLKEFNAKNGLLAGTRSANYVQVVGSATGSAVAINAQGTDTNINITLAPKGTGTVGLTNAVLGGTVTAGGSAGTSGQVLQTTGTGVQWVSASSLTAGSATNVAGGSANSLAYQTGAGATGFVTAPSTSGTYLQWNGTAFVWSSVTGGATVTNDSSTNASLYPVFTSTTSGTMSAASVSSTKFSFNPSTGGLVAPNVVASNGLLVNSATVTTSYNVGSGNNAMSVGPITVGSGATVTIASGNRWIVI